MVEPVELTTILGDEDLLLDQPIDSKAAVLAAAAEHLGRSTGVPSEVILKALSDREALGSTAIKHGVAVPHAGLDNLPRPAAVFFRLAHPIEFDAPDDNPVDLVFVTVWPSEHRSGLLSALGHLCRNLREPSVRQALRTASTPQEIKSALSRSADSDAKNSS
jgi:PTS system nitrogen regulatory IIA component